MAQYKCFNCEKATSTKTLQKRFVCPGCGSRIFFKPRTQIVKLKAI